MSGPVSVRLTAVTRRYGATTALDAVSLDAPAGRILALLGESGSGKSTALRVIAGLEPVDAGAVAFGETVMSAPGRLIPPERRRVGLVFQDYALFPHLTAAANVAFGLSGRSPDPKGLAREWLARVGLAARDGAYPHEMSGGEQQRVALARALAPAPAAVLLDEPFSGLDPSLRGELRDITRDALREAGATAVFVTHDAQEALYMADTMAILAKGRVAQAGDPRTLYAAPASVAVAAALGPVNVWRGRVQGGRIETPFGPVAAAGLPEGAPAEAIVRWSAVTLAPGASAHVTERRALGREDVVWVAAGGAVWRVLTALDEGPAPGARVDLRIDATGAFAFPAAAPDR